MKRRKFLSVLLAVLGSTALGSFVYPLVRFFAPPARTAKAKSISVNKSEIRLAEAKEVIFDNTPVIIINRPEKGYIAFSRVCTHLGCLVMYEKSMRQLVCPCHAGTFDLEGNVISGPPPKPLSVIPLRVEGEFLVIG